MILRVKVHPGAGRDRVVGWLGDVLKVSVSAPPEKGKANQAVVELLAQVLSIPKRSIRVVSGSTSREKSIEILGLEEPDLKKRVTS